MSPRTQTILFRFLLGLVLTEIPAAMAVLANPAPDYRLLAIGLLGGLAAAIEKYVSPDVLASNDTSAQAPTSP